MKTDHLNAKVVHSASKITQFEMNNEGSIQNTLNSVKACKLHGAKQCVIL